MGIEAVGVVGRANEADLARACGCDVVIDNSAGDLQPSARRRAGLDVIFGAPPTLPCAASEPRHAARTYPHGEATLRDSWRSLAPGGKLVVYGVHTTE